MQPMESNSPVKQSETQSSQEPADINVFLMEVAGMIKRPYDVIKYMM